MCIRHRIQYALQRERDDPEMTATLDSMLRSSRKMADVTDKLLLLAHAEATPSTLLTGRVDLATVVSSVLEETIVLAQRRDIDLGADLGEHLDVAGSDSLLTALVMNLVDNAVRYTQPGGCVTVAGRRDGETVVLDVIDNGPGIPAEARPHVFKRFYRVSADTEGSGLGLAIVREIAQAHDGMATLAPGPGNRGVVVTVRLPAYR